MGTELLDQAMSKLLKSDGSGKVTIPISTQDHPNLWNSPFAIAFLIVGFRRLRYSIPGVVEILDSDRVSRGSGGHKKQNRSTQD